MTMRVTIAHLMPLNNCAAITVTPVRTDGNHPADLPSKVLPGETREFIIEDYQHLVVKAAG